MNYEERKEFERKLKEKIDLEYPKIQEEGKEALCRIERIVKSKKSNKNNEIEL